MSVLKDPPACLQLKTQTYETNAPVELSERAFQVSEELNLPDGRPQIARLVSCSLTPVVQEQGLVGSKAVLKGTANLQITYLDNENALRTLSFSVPFSQYCQMEGDYDQDETLESVLLVTGVQLEPVASEQSQKLLFGAGLLAQCMVVQPQALTLCEDAYSTKGEFQPQWETQEHTMRLDAQTLREPVRASFPVQAAAVLDCRVYRTHRRLSGQTTALPSMLRAARGPRLYRPGRRGAVRDVPHGGQLPYGAERKRPLRGRVYDPAGGLRLGGQRRGRAAL
ncbi:MAG: DUF3794 domain-containing protein [Acutalibacteraceae bacterium]